jgi:cation transport ATPase
MHHQKTAERFTVDLAISMILAMALLLALIVVTQGSPLAQKTPFESGLETAAFNRCFVFVVVLGFTSCPVAMGLAVNRWVLTTLRFAHDANP